jgi:TonB family protein
MIELLLYLVKSLLLGALFFGCYLLVMRRESYLTFNRFYLLSSAGLMVFLPLIGSILPFDLLNQNRQAPLPVITLPEVVITGSSLGTAEQQKAILNWAFMGYGLITLAMLAGLLLSILRIIRFYRTSLIAEKLEKNIYLVSEKGSPFSFLGRIFISKQYAGHPGLINIIIHENAHIRQKHMIDLLLLELISSIFWFNPFFFLIKRALREVHEYLADREVIRQGAEPITYQQLLFNEVSGNPQYIIANNFNLLTKKRIIMLIKKSGKMAAFRIGILMPLIIAVAFVIALIHSTSIMAQSPTTPQQPKKMYTAKPVIKNETKTTKPQQKSVIKHVKAQPQDQKKEPLTDQDVVFTVVEDMPQFPGGDEARIKYMVTSIKYPEEARKKGVQGTVYVTYIVEMDGSISNVKILRGIGGGCDEEAARVISEMPKWDPGMQRGKAVRVQFNMPINFKLGDEKVKKPAK